jgi:hypothetical protein
LAFTVVPILFGVVRTPDVILCVSNERASKDIMGSSSSIPLIDSTESSASSYVLNPMDDDSDEEIQLKPLLLALLLSLEAEETLRVSVDKTDGEGESSTLLKRCCCCLISQFSEHSTEPMLGPSPPRRDRKFGVDVSCFMAKLF